MKTLSRLLSLLFALTLALPVQHAQASNYPPDYFFCSARDVKRTGPFEVIRDIRNYSKTGYALTIAYRGYLTNLYPAGEISFYVRLNGQDIFVPATQGSYGDAYVYLRPGVRDCAICADYKAAGWPECAAAIEAGTVNGSWLCAQPSADEQELFLYAFDANGLSNAWDIEVAAEAHGRWDSNFGANFKTRFESKNGCY